jgi:hypothetical protein
MKAPLILLISEKMDNNKKKGRYEDRLIRMGEKARAALGLADEKTVELWPDGSSLDRINRSRVLEIFQAYSSDLKDAKERLPEKDYERIGFVTSRTFDFICHDKRKKFVGKRVLKENIWIANTIEDTVIGADPEFLLINSDGSVKYAAEVGGFSHTDILGSDGPWAELRPDPDVDVGAFVDNIREILRHHKNAELIQKYSWMGGCYYYAPREGGNERAWPMGGHIHIGTPAKLAAAIREADQDIYSAALYGCLAKVLDEYVAIPMMRVDGVEESTRRRGQYGYYGDVRMDHGRLEYRALSGEWLTHPKLATAVIGTVKAIAHTFFKLLDEASYKRSMFMTASQQSSIHPNELLLFDDSFASWQNIEIMKALGATKTSKTMREILHRGKIKFTKPFFDRLSKRLKSLSGYREYSEFIDAFIEIVNLPNDLLFERDKDLKHTWVGNKDFVI